MELRSGWLSLAAFLLLSGASEACQYDHIPLFDEKTRSFIRCDLWHPVCPPKGKCEVAGREVRGKLGLRRDQADFLCCIDPENLPPEPQDPNAPIQRTSRTFVDEANRMPLRTSTPKRVPPRPRHGSSDPFNSYDASAAQHSVYRPPPSDYVHSGQFPAANPHQQPQIHPHHHLEREPPRYPPPPAATFPTLPETFPPRSPLASLGASVRGSVIDRVSLKLNSELRVKEALRNPWATTHSPLLPNFAWQPPTTPRPSQSSWQPPTPKPRWEGYRMVTAPTTPYSAIYPFDTTARPAPTQPSPPQPSTFDWNDRGFGPALSSVDRADQYRVASGREAGFPTPIPFLQRLEERLKISGGGGGVEELKRLSTQPPPDIFDAWGRRINIFPIYDAWGRRINEDGSLWTNGTTTTTPAPLTPEATIFPPHLVPMAQKKGGRDEFDLGPIHPNDQKFDRGFPWEKSLPPGHNPQHYMPSTTRRPLPTARWTAEPPTTPRPAWTTPAVPPASPLAPPMTPLMPAMPQGQLNSYGGSYGEPELGDSPKVLPILVGDASSPTSDGVYKWSGSATLIQDDGYNVLVDSGTAANRQELIRGLASHGLRPENVQILVVTHGHPDHIGNDNLFPLAVKVFNNLLYKGNDIMESRQMDGDVFQLTKNVEIWKTEGHTMQHNSAVVRKVEGFGSVAVAGDLFINAEDLIDPTIWNKRSLDSQTQSRNRLKILCQVEVIVPGHGPMYRLTPDFKAQQCKAYDRQHQNVYRRLRRRRRPAFEAKAAERFVVRPENSLSVYHG